MRIFCVAAAALLVGCGGTSYQDPLFGPQLVVVRVSVGGNGFGVVASETFECRMGTCTHAVMKDSRVHLVAFPDTRTTFVVWGGACAGLSDCNLMPAHDVDITATFTRTTSPPPPPHPASRTSWRASSAPVDDGSKQ